MVILQVLSSWDRANVQSASSVVSGPPGLEQMVGLQDLSRRGVPDPEQTVKQQAPPRRRTYRGFNNSKTAAETTSERPDFHSLDPIQPFIDPLRRTRPDFWVREMERHAHRASRTLSPPEKSQIIALANQSVGTAPRPSYPKVGSSSPLAPEIAFLYCLFYSLACLEKRVGVNPPGGTPTPTLQKR